MTSPEAPRSDPPSDGGDQHASGSRGAGAQLTASDSASPVLGLHPRALSHPVCPRAKSMWRLNALITNVGILAVLVVAALLWEPVRIWSLILAAVTVVSALVEIFLAPSIRYRVHRWDLTDQAVYARSGWITQHWQVAPFSRIQTVEAKRGPVQRMFRLASVKVTTASASADVTIVGLDEQDADSLVQSLTEATQSTLGDAT
ncbi:PH domain-containing protein [Pseudoclavibacter sp. CFCC 13611]|uniref:PH domain-containing protein n=1 Tax=Pseudoclavibacter sp. CFCC 13611 TaxID=2615178 RepID=UPI001CE413B6|nr:PH domain-containing protein [Pseudoclavibacter sp. CFCC 13611]